MLHRREKRGSSLQINGTSAEAWEKNLEALHVHAGQPEWEGLQEKEQARYQCGCRAQPKRSHGAEALLSTSLAPLPHKWLLAMVCHNTELLSYQ